MVERNGLLSTFHHWLFQKNYVACDWLKQIARGAFFIILFLKSRKCVFLIMAKGRKHRHFIKEVVRFDTETLCLYA